MVAGLPETITSGPASRTITAPAAQTVFALTVTPGPIKTPAATQHPSSITIGFVMRSKVGFLKSCEPVQRNTLWDKHTLEAMDTRSSVRIRTSSPIQTWFPTSKRHGKVIFTRERITTPFPIFAPKARSTATRRDDGNGNQLSKNNERANHQSASTQAGAPRENSGFLKRERSTGSVGFITYSINTLPTSGATTKCQTLNFSP